MATITGFPHRQNIEVSGAAPPAPGAPDRPFPPLFPHWASSDRPRQVARLVSTPQQAATEAAQRQANPPPTPEETALARRLNKIQDHLQATGRCSLNGDLIADNPRRLW